MKAAAQTRYDSIDATHVGALKKARCPRHLRVVVAMAVEMAPAMAVEMAVAVVMVVVVAM